MFLINCALKFKHQPGYLKVKTQCLPNIVFKPVSIFEGVDERTSLNLVQAWRLALSDRPNRLGATIFLPHWNLVMDLVSEMWFLINLGCGQCPIQVKFFAIYHHQNPSKYLV
jgi:hypothetical protein